MISLFLIFLLFYIIISPSGVAETKQKQKGNPRAFDQCPPPVVAREYKSDIYFIVLNRLSKSINVYMTPTRIYYCFFFFLFLLHLALQVETVQFSPPAGAGGLRGLCLAILRFDGLIHLSISAISRST